MNWFLIFSVAIFIDVVCFLLGFLGIGLIVSRVISFFVGATFAFWFLITGVKGWGWRLIAGSAGEVIPVLGDFLPIWTVTVWRIHQKQPQSATGDAPVNKEDLVLEQAEEDREYQQQQA